MYQKKYSERWKEDRKKRKKFTHRYDIIPPEVLMDPILEIGSGEGIRQVNCLHKKFFLNADYLGIDILKPEFPELNIIEGDIITFIPDRRFKFNTVLMVGSLEHIALNHWSFVCNKLKVLCKENGNIVLYVPYKESINKFYQGVEDHLVFGITKELMRYFFPGAKIKVIYDQMLKEYNESFFWGIARWIKRLLTLDKKIFKIFPKRVGLLIIWNKR